MKEREMLEHNFKKGVNNITYTKICKWRNEKINDWYAFLWYIADYSKIIDFDHNWFKVYIVSNKQLNFFYDMVIKYNSDVEEHNYSIDKTDDLWQDHKRGVTRNREILERLAKL